MGLRLFIVDDHDEFRSFAASLLGHGGFEVAGDAPNGEAAIDAVETLHPDVVLLDIQLPGIDGIEVAARLAARSDPPAVILMSTRSASSYGSRLARARARGFIPKQQLSGAAVAAMLDGH